MVKNSLSKPTQNKQKTIVRLFFRRANPTGNVSIESSFAAMQTHFPKQSPFELAVFRSSFYSIGFWQRLKAIREVGKHKAAINHVTGDTNFLALGLPRRQTILTIHDCGLLQGKNVLARSILKWFWLKLPVWKTRFITTVSEASKRDIIHYTACRADKITVIPTVILPHFKYSPKPFNKDYPTFLHIGNSPNKNLARHAEALAKMPCRLHIIGKISDKEVAKLNDLQLDYRIDYNLNDAEMLQAYQQADILLFCSTIEGFGMPILEAQSVGRVVITSQVSAMPEVAGSGACLVDPLSTDAIRMAIKALITHDSYRETLIQRGLENVKRFDPAVVAQAYEALYQKVIS
jgi:glycosyltransferase involved in cell wall biosynthesis